MKKFVVSVVAAATLGISSLASATVQAPYRTIVANPIVSQYMNATVTNDMSVAAVAEMWQTVFKIGPDGQRVRSSVTLQPGESITFRVACYTTTATYGWWTQLGPQRSTTTWAKCR